MEIRNTLETGIGYRIYFYKKTFFVETVCRESAQGFNTLQAARECAYYMGYRESK